MLLNTLDYEQYEKWKQYFAKYDDKLQNIYFKNYDTEIFGKKLTEKEFELNKFYIDFCFLKFKDKSRFYSNFEIIVIKSFLFNKIDDLIKKN